MDEQIGQNIMTGRIPVAVGEFSAGAGRRAILASPAEIAAENGAVRLRCLIQKPGAVRLAIIATLITFVVVQWAANAFGYAAGPGYLIWYWIFSRRRRSAIELDLTKAVEIVTDDAKRRIAVRLPVNDTPSWIGINPRDAYPRVKSLLLGIPGPAFSGAPVKKSSPFIVVAIIVVVCVIGIVAAISIPSLMRARLALTESHLMIVESAIVEYQTDTGSLPDSLEELTAKDLVGNESLLKDTWGRKLVYRKSGDSFTLKSLGRDGVESGDDVVVRR